MNLWGTCNMVKKTKTVKCLNCKCEFESEIDKMGVLYNRLCEKHRYLNENEAYAEKLRNISKCYIETAKKASKYDRSIFYNKQLDVWEWYRDNKNGYDKEVAYSHKDEMEVVSYKKNYLTNELQNAIISYSKK